MKCEICHEGDAVAAIHKSVDGKDRELYVCAKCAEREGSAASAHRAASPRDAKPDGAAGMTPEEFGKKLSGMLAHAIFDAVGGSLAEMTDTRCPKCGITRAEYRKEGRLGCPACYRAFAGELEPAILDMHRGSVHVGKVPGAVVRNREAAHLEAKLRHAVAEQRFEEASDLRERIRRLKSGGDAGADGDAGEGGRTC